MVRITRHKVGNYEQFRITLPAQLIRALGWREGDELQPILDKGGIVFRKVEG